MKRLAIALLIAALAACGAAPCLVDNDDPIRTVQCPESGWPDQADAAVDGEGE